MFGQVGQSIIQSPQNQFQNDFQNASMFNSGQRASRKDIWKNNFEDPQNRSFEKMQNQQQYHESLQKQIEFKKNLKEQEKMEEINIIRKQLQSRNYLDQIDYGNIQRDEQGRIKNTRAKPHNPNYNVHGDWFSWNPYGYDEQRKKQEEQRKRRGQQQVQQFQMNPNISLPNLQLPDNQEFILQQQQLEQKQKELLDLHNHQMELEKKRRQLELDMLEEKKRRELEEIQKIKDAAEQDQRILREKNEFLLRQQQLLFEQEQMRLMERRKQKERIEAAERKQKLELERDRILVEQRIIQELPLEITKNVKETVDGELAKLRHEMNFVNNTMTEELINLKHQLKKAQEKKIQLKQELGKLGEELQKTQTIEEIRQRELYQAFVASQPQEIYKSNQRLQQEELPINFQQLAKDMYHENNKNKQSNINQYLQNNQSTFVSPSYASTRQNSQMENNQNEPFDYDINDLSLKQLLNQNSSKLQRLDEIDSFQNQGYKYLADQAFIDLYHSNKPSFNVITNQGNNYLAQSMLQ